MKVIFLGTPEFAVPALQKLTEDDFFEVCAVVTQPDRKGHRNRIEFSAVKKFALEHALPLYQFEHISDAEPAEFLRSLQADVMVTAAYGQLLKENVLEAVRYGVFNIHGSLLPKYRGAAPIQWAVIRGEKKTGVTIMKTQRGLDCGDIYGVRETEILPEMTAGDVFTKLSVLGAELLVETLKNLKNITPIQQNEAEATYCGKITKDFARIDWSQSASEIDCFIRGLNPSPIACTYFSGKKWKIHCAKIAEIVPPQLGERNGAFCVTDRKLYVRCADGAMELRTIQPENGKAMSAADFINGLRVSDGCLEA